MSEDPTTYQSQDPQGVIAGYIRESLRSVVRIQSTVFYRTYQFDPEQLPLVSDVPWESLDDIVVRTSTDNHSTAGTAIAFSQTFRRTALLTTSHIVSYPDTIFHHARGGASGEEQPLEAVSVKERVNYLLFMEDGMESFRLEIDDPHRDLSVLVSNTGRGSSLRALPFRLGEADELEWADLIYAVGYPRGVQMVTSGIVSESSLRRWQGFTVDSSFNRGFSGGAVFALRNDGDGLDWVGVITSASAEREYILTPGDLSQEEYAPDIPYTDSIFVERATRINYGISHATGIGEIRQFLEDNRNRIEELGFSIPDFR